MDTHNGPGKSEKKQWPHLSLSRIKDAIGLVVSVLAVVAFIRTCSQENALRTLDYDVLSLTYEPRLSVAETPTPSKIEIDTLSLTHRRNRASGSRAAINSDTFDLRFELTVFSPITIVNTSEGHLAKVWAILSADTIPNPKAFITGRDEFPSGQDKWRPWPRYTKSHLLPGDTLTIMTETKVRYINDSAYVIHILIVYQNELGHLYHTHASLPYRLIPRYWVPQQVTPVTLCEESIRRRVESLMAQGELMKGLPPVNIYETYTQQEARMAKRNLERIMPGIGP